MVSIAIFQKKTIRPITGGISRMSQFYYDILMEAGYDVWLLSEINTGPPVSERQLYCAGKSLDQIEEAFVSVCRQKNISLIIYQDAINPADNYYIPYFAKALGIKVVSVVHSSLRGIYGISGRRSCGWIHGLAKTVVERCVNFYFKLKYSDNYKKMISLSDRVVLLSDILRSEFKWFCGTHDFCKFLSIYNPMVLKNPQYSALTKQKSILNVGTLNQAKRQDILLKIWHKIESKYPDWKLDIVGDGPERESLKRLANKLNLKRVFFHGFQSPEKYYEEAAIFCLTSGFEGFGLVIVESMAYGCVPVAFNSFANAQEIVDDGVNGYLVKAFDINQFTNVLIKLMNDSRLLCQMATNARVKSKSFDRNLIKSKWIQLINELTNQ